MGALGRFGLDPILFAAQLVNFLVIAWVINRFLLRPLMANLKARREKLAKGLEDAEKARMALEDAAKEKEKVLQGASAEAFRMLENARDEAERLRAAALERQEMEKAVQGLSLQLSGRILESAVEGLFDDEEKARIVARGLERIGRAGRS
jgi:F-type H+-transporting ATPase subunit b